MPLVSVHRGSRGPKYLSGGTQFVDGTLDLPSSPWTIYLSQAAYPATGEYVLFDYKNGSFDGLDLGQIVFNDDDLLLSSVSTVFDVPAEKKVILRLQSKDTNGTQYVGGTLDVSDGSYDVYLSSSLYKTAGTYVLFRFPNGYSVNGPLTNINVIPPGGRTLVTPPYQDVNDIKFVLG
jgi:hypothetical protein